MYNYTYMRTYMNNENISRRLLLVLPITQLFLIHLTSYTFNRRQQELSWLRNTELLAYLREQLHKYGAVLKSVEKARQDSIWAYPTRPLSLPADFIRLICAHKSFLHLLIPSPPTCLLPRLYFSLSASIFYSPSSNLVKTRRKRKMTWI